MQDNSNSSKCSRSLAFDIIYERRYEIALELAEQCTIFLIMYIQYGT